VLAQLYICVSYYFNRVAFTGKLSSGTLLSIDNNINLGRIAIFCMNLDNNYETFNATVLSLNILLVQGALCQIDLSLIIGNQIDTLLSGFLLTFTLYFYVARMVILTF
jgi:hypothetical protein